MINRTEKGYELNGWECQPMKLPAGHKLTPTEARAAVCRMNGLSHKDSALEMSCSVSNIRQMWSSLYFKTHTANAIVALNKLVDFGALQRLHMVIAMLVFTWCTLPSLNTSPDTQTTDLARRYRSRSSQRRSSSHRGAQLQAIADLLGDGAYELLNQSDVRAIA